jgi:hypothetical protein
MDGAALPVTRYVFSGDVSIAYQVMGDGEYDIVLVPGLVSHVEMLHESPGYTAFCAAFQRLLASLPLINEVRDCLTEYRAHLR